MTEVGVPAYQRLQESLEATNVLSPHFRTHILTLALKINEEAYKLGRESTEESTPRTYRNDEFDSVRGALALLVGSGKTAQLAYTDRNGRYTERAVQVAHFVGDEQVLCIDVDKDEPRYFVLDRIDWIEVEW